MRRSGRLAAAGIGLALLAVAAVDVATASNVSAGLGERGNVSVPTWLYATTGAAVIAASALMSMFVTDRELIEELHGSRRDLADARSGLREGASTVGGALGLLGLGTIVVVGLLGPQVGNVNLGVLLVFVVGRAALTLTAYLIGNPWPLLDPWRRIAGVLPTGHRSYPERLGTWPAVAGLGVLIWLEIALPVTQSPRLLAGLVVAYTLYTLAGAVAFGREPWFRNADPVSVWYRFYGAVGPLQSRDGTLSLRPYGARLRSGDLLGDLSGVAFVLVLIWELTYSGVVATPPGAAAVEAVASIGLPLPLVYLGLFVVGYAAFLGAYALATYRCRERAQTYVAPGYLARRFAGPLLAIAAGYHFAHYGGFLLTLAPTLVDVASNPLTALDASVLVLPWWFGHVEALAILVGHVLAVWLAHGTAVSTFPGRLQAIRSQYPYVAVMAAFTMASLWIVSLPTVSPP